MSVSSGTAAPLRLRSTRGVVIGVVIGAVAIGGAAVGCSPSNARDLLTQGTSDTGSMAPTSDDDSRGDTATTGASDDDGHDADTRNDGDGAAYEDDGDDPGCSFTCPDPPPPPVPPGSGGSLVECDIVAQNCPEGEKCMPWADDGESRWNSSRCTPLSPTPASAGQDCHVRGNSVSGIDSCDWGLVCTNVDVRTNQGVCTALCTDNSPTGLCDDPDAICASIEGIVPLCLPACDPTAVSCPPDNGCALVGQVFACRPLQPKQTAGDGEWCTQWAVCSSGSLCIHGQGLQCDALPGQGCCTPLCDLDGGGDTACEDPQRECTPWFPDPAPPPYEHIGACLPS